ncbi:MAG: glycerol-3-phosphate dehydrogenase/oxidase [Flavobacteriaceae bacterium]|nr:glycerol-3-phosphate dehydrogenase/oxidase [Flavobacteriaceae bacterium]
MNFSILDRKQQIEVLKEVKFDLVIIGGGVTGSGIALDAASRGLKTCLIEKNDFASGTSNKSTKLIHGGLRYLKQLEIGLVKESGTERAIVHKLAPHLVVPEKMLLPLIEGGTYGKMLTSIGLKIYDILANVEGEDKRKMLSKEETLKKEPLLDEDRILGGGYYAEYRTDDARLTIELLKKSSELGAIVSNYCEMVRFNYNNEQKIKSVHCIDKNSGEAFDIRARNFVSAAGPWVDLLRKKDASMNKKHLHLTKGVHLVFPSEKLPIKQSVYFDVPDGRMIFAIPRGRVTYVGTTDTNYSGNLERVVATKMDAEYLLNAVNNMFPSVDLKVEDIESNWAGLRPLIHEDDKDPSELSRKDEIFISETGLISIAGGKLTGYRRMAQRVIESVLKTMPAKRRGKFNKSKTQKISLVSPTFESKKEVKAYQDKLEGKLDYLGADKSYYAWYLISTYGRQAKKIIAIASDFENENAKERLIRAELWYSIHHEMVNSLTDFFVRRTGSLYFNIENVRQYSALVLNDFIDYLGWDSKRVQEEKDLLEQLIQDATTFYDSEFEA